MSVSIHNFPGLGSQPCREDGYIYEDRALEWLDYHLDKAADELVNLLVRKNIQQRGACPLFAFG